MIDMTRKESPLEVAVKGSVAGPIGTAAITVAMKGAPVIMQQLGVSPPEPKTQAAKQKAAGEPTEKLAEKVSTGVLDRPMEPEAKQTAGQAVHWGYGTAWGVLRGLLAATGMAAKTATALHGGAIYGAAQVTLPALEIAPPAVFWAKEEIAIDAFHHAVYATATGVVYELIANHRS
jgi:hypothetical protein